MRIIPVYGETMPVAEDTAPCPQRVPLLFRGLINLTLELGWGFSKVNSAEIPPGELEATPLFVARSRLHWQAQFMTNQIVTLLATFMRLLSHFSRHPPSIFPCFCYLCPAFPSLHLSLAVSINHSNAVFWISSASCLTCFVSVPLSSSFLSPCLPPSVYLSLSPSPSLSCSIFLVMLPCSIYRFHSCRDTKMCDLEISRFTRFECSTESYVKR